MFFTYWTDDARPGQRSLVESLPMSAEWAKEFSDFKVYDDSTVIPLLGRWGDDVPDLFRRIRMPSCKSDIARLALLSEFGGVYIDAHTGIGNKETLYRLMGIFPKFEVLLFDLVPKHQQDGDVWIPNGAIYSRPRSPIIELLINTAIENIKEHHAKELSTSEYAPYNIAVLTGAWIIVSKLFYLVSRPFRIKDEFVDRIKIWSLREDASDPIKFYKYYGYRVPSVHWSERQKHEPLFARPETRRQESAFDNLAIREEANPVDVDSRSAAFKGAAIAMSTEPVNEKKRWIYAHIDETIVPSTPDVDLRGIRAFLDTNSDWLNHCIRFIETYVRIIQHVKPRRTSRIAETGNLSATSEFLVSDGFSIESLKGDFRSRIEAPSDTYDLLLSCEVFEHIKDQDTKDFNDLVCMNFSGVEAYISEMYRVLRPGGYLAMTTPNACSLLAIELILSYRAPLSFWPHVREYPPADVIRLCEGGGFQTVFWDTFFAWFYLDKTREKRLDDLFASRGASKENRGEDAFFLFKKPDAKQGAELCSTMD
jgi:SAM-dependent methyltransferase